MAHPRGAPSTRVTISTEDKNYLKGLLHRVGLKQLKEVYGNLYIKHLAYQLKGKHSLIHKDYHKLADQWKLCDKMKQLLFDQEVITRTEFLNLRYHINLKGKKQVDKYLNVSDRYFYRPEMKRWKYKMFLEQIIEMG